MNAAECNNVASAPAATPISQQSCPQLHRIRTVRQQQGVSVRSAARKMGIHASDVRAQEDESCDLLLSQLHSWRKVLDVPIGNLLVDQDDTLSAPVLKRASMVKMMKTAAAILEKADTPQVRRLAAMLTEQLIEIMPELEEVSPWHTVGQRRSLTEFGRIAESPIADELLRAPK